MKRSSSASSASFPRRKLALLLLVVASALCGRAEEWAPNITLTAGWQSNATNAHLDSDQVDSLQVMADGVASHRYAFGTADSLHLTGHLAAEWWPRYEGLQTGAIGARTEWRHKFGLGAMAPVLSAEIAGDLIAAKEEGRRGSRLGFTVAFQKRFNDVTRVTVAHELAQRYARVAVFDHEANETSLTLDRDFGSLKRLTFSVHHRDGEVVSYATPPRPDLVALASSRVEVDTFDRPMVAYSIDARTWRARVAFARALDEHSAIVGAYEWRNTERKPLRYVNHLVSIALVHQF